MAPFFLRMMNLGKKGSGGDCDPSFKLNLSHGISMGKFSPPALEVAGRSARGERVL